MVSASSHPKTAPGEQIATGLTITRSVPFTMRPFLVRNHHGKHRKATLRWFFDIANALVPGVSASSRKSSDASVTFSVTGAD